MRKKSAGEETSLIRGTNSCSEKNSLADADPKVSIGFPVFNGARYLEKSIESVLSQDFADFELLISDNGSTDSTWEICCQYAKRDKRIRLHRHRQNLGAIFNFRFVLEKSSGEYFMWHPHDDFLDRAFLSECVSFLESNLDYVLCYSNNRTVNEDCKEIELWKSHDHCLSQDSPAERFEQLARFIFPNWYIYGLIRRKALYESRFWQGRRMHDTVLVYWLAIQGKFHRLPMILRTYQVRVNQDKRKHMVALQNSLWGGNKWDPLYFLRCYWDTFAIVFHPDLDVSQRRRILRYFLWHWWPTNSISDDLLGIVQRLTYDSARNHDLLRFIGRLFRRMLGLK